MEAKPDKCVAHREKEREREGDCVYAPGCSWVRNDMSMCRRFFQFLRVIRFFKRMHKHTATASTTSRGRQRQTGRQTDKQTDRPTGRRMTKCIYFQFFIYYMYASAEYEHSIILTRRVCDDFQTGGPTAGASPVLCR